MLVLMREPVIEDNASDHALFCKYAAELLERVTGKSLATSTAVPSLSRITKVCTDMSILTELNGFVCEESQHTEICANIYSRLLIFHQVKI